MAHNNFFIFFKIADGLRRSWDTSSAARLQAVKAHQPQSMPAFLREHFKMISYLCYGKAINEQDQQCDRSQEHTSQPQGVLW